MADARSPQQPLLPLAVSTLALVVLTLLAGSIGFAVIRWLLQMLLTIVALVGMVLLGRYLWFRGRRRYG